MKIIRIIFGTVLCLCITGCTAQNIVNLNQRISDVSVVNHEFDVSLDALLDDLQVYLSDNFEDDYTSLRTESEIIDSYYLGDYVNTSERCDVYYDIRQEGDNAPKLSSVFVSSSQGKVETIGFAGWYMDDGIDVINEYMKHLFSIEEKSFDSWFNEAVDDISFSSGYSYQDYMKADLKKIYETSNGIIVTVKNFQGQVTVIYQGE